MTLRNELHMVWVSILDRLLFRTRKGDPLRLAAALAKSDEQAGVSRPINQGAPLADPTSRYREQLAHRARVRNEQRVAITRAFGANRPVDNRNELCGRQSELGRLTSAVCDSHMHGLIYGPRGSGKTSLARVFGDYADERGFTVIYLSCAGGEEFGELMAPYLDDLPASTFGVRQADYDRILAEIVPSLNPRSLAGLLARIQEEQVILILDEFDRVESSAVKSQAAMLAKLLSDMRSNVCLLFVGISGNVEDLIGAHASIRRHLIAVSVSPLGEGDVDQFITEASQVSGVNFADEARRLIRWLARGSPYHMRLFCLQAALSAVEAGYTRVDSNAANNGVERALADWATVNDRDARLFTSLAQSTSFSVAALEAFAQTAISLADFTKEQVATVLAGAALPPSLAESLIAALAPALRLLPDLQDRYVFDDALAPQFLLATCALARQSRGSAGLAVIAS